MKLQDVERNYDHLASRYDLWNRWVSQPLLRIEALRQKTVSRLSLADGGSVLDIGCGTGLNFPYLVQGVGFNGRIIGLDYSPGMLSQARHRVDEAAWPGVRLVRGDAATLAGVGGPFDAVLSTWALGIVDDLPAALGRAVDVLKPGGRLAILDFHRTRPERGIGRLLNPLTHFALRFIGADSPEDLDDERLAARWSQGKALLRERLSGVQEEAYFGGSGFLLWGQRP